jgi:hypothetical protein
MTTSARAGSRPLRARARAPRPTLAGDLRVLGLPVLEADLLRDFLARAGVRVETDDVESVVRIPAGENRDLAVDAVLALVERWAVDERFTELPVEYRGSSYRLVTGLARSAG